MFLFSKTFRQALGPNQRPIQWEPETLSIGVKRPERAPAYSAVVKNEWRYTSAPSISLRDVHKNVTFFFFSWYLLVGTEESHKGPSQNSRYYGRHSNPAPPNANRKAYRYSN